VKLEKLYKDIFEANVGDKLFADPDAAYALRNDDGIDRNFYKWVERVYGPDYEPNTPEEDKMLFALGKYFGQATYAKELGKYVGELKALKAKFPSMLDPKNAKGYNQKFEGYAMRGAKLPMDQYEKLIRKSELYGDAFGGATGLVKDPGITYKSRGQYGFTSFSTDFTQAAKFGRSFKEKDWVGVVYGVKLSDPNLVVNPSFANELSDYKESETLYVGNEITPDFVVIVDPRMESNFLYDIKAYEAENDLEEFSIKRADFYPKWAKTHTPRLQDFTVDGMPKLDKDKKPRVKAQSKIDKLKALQAKKYAKNESISLHEVYTDMLREGVWSSSALARMRRKPMDSRYFITDEEGNVLDQGLKTKASVRAYFYDGAKMGGYLGGKIPKVVNVHDNKLDGKVIDQYFWKGKGGIDIDNPTAGSYSEIDPQYVKYKDDIEEGYTDLLNEIGDLDPSKALPYDKVKDTTRSVPGTESGGPRFVKGKQEYAFDFVQDQNGYPSKKLMLVKLGYDGDGTMRIDFNPVGTGDIPILGDSYKSAYTIMNTVGAIVKQSLKDTLEKGITKTLYAAAKLEYDKENPLQRQQMYDLFIKKAFPGAVINRYSTTLPDNYPEYL
jgi:hypothetical protein